MPRIAGTALHTAHGDLQQTLAALDKSEASPGSLKGDLIDLLTAVTTTALNGQSADMLLFATTKGDVDRWSADLVAESPTGAGSPQWVAQQIGQRLGIPAIAISGACASGPLAMGVAARGIWSGHWQRVVIVGGDRIGAFIRDGFAALQAIDPDRCRPFDAKRAGLQLGEMVAAIVLINPKLMPDAPYFLQGWGASLDGNHLTGPTRDGSGMARALRMALLRAQDPQPALVIAHGTGTRYNDDSESLAYATVCPTTPVTGLKGIIGHTLGACGVGEAALALAMHQRQQASGCAHLMHQGCAGAISVLPPGKHPLSPGPILGANAGFGGINGAYVIGNCPSSVWRCPSYVISNQATLMPTGWEQRDASDKVSSGAWDEPGTDDQLPRLHAKMVLGHIDASWGRMDLSCRALVTLGRLCGTLPEQTAIVLATNSGCAASDRLHEQARLAGSVDPQRFAYTLPTTPIGEASIRLRLFGPGFTIHGANDELVLAISSALLGDGCPAVLVAWIESDRGPHRATAMVLRPRN